VGSGNYITLEASVEPEGGFFAWTPVPGLIPGTSMATFSGETPGDVTIEVTYRPQGGGECQADHTVTVFDVESVSGPPCVNTGTTLTAQDFTVLTNPAGFEHLVPISPLTFSTLSQSSEETVTAYSGTGAASDEATTTLTVVNSEIKTKMGFSIEIPNYVSKPLEALGLAERLTLKITDEYVRYLECCTAGDAGTTEGSTTVAVGAEAGPWTILGVPLPPSVKKYVTLDAINITLSGEGNATITGKYAACEAQTNWSVSGNLKAGIAAASEVMAKIPKVLVLKGKLAGSTGVTEKLEILVSTIKISGNWDGLTIAGEVIIKTPLGDILPREVSILLIKGTNLPPFSFELPSLKEAD
jgi:hypothetical protein